MTNTMKWVLGVVLVVILLWAGSGVWLYNRGAHIAHLEDAMAQRNVVTSYAPYAVYIPNVHEEGAGVPRDSSVKMPDTTKFVSQIDDLQNRLAWALTPFAVQLPKDTLRVIARPDSAGEPADTVGLIPYAATVDVNDLWNKIASLDIVFDNPIYWKQKNTVQSVVIPTTESGLWGMSLMGWMGWLVAAGVFALAVLLR